MSDANLPLSPFPMCFCSSLWGKIATAPIPCGLAQHGLQTLFLCLCFGLSFSWGGGCVCNRETTNEADVERKTHGEDQRQNDRGRRGQEQDQEPHAIAGAFPPRAPYPCSSRTTPFCRRPGLPLAPASWFSLFPPSLEPASASYSSDSHLALPQGIGAPWGAFEEPTCVPTELRSR